MVMWCAGIKAHCGDVAECAHVTALPGGAERVAAVLNQPEIMFFGECRYRVEIEDVAQGVGDHDRPGLLAAGSFKLSYIDFVGRERHVDEDRNEPVLNDGIDGGRETCSDGDDFIAGFETAGRPVWER